MPELVNTPFSRFEVMSSPAAVTLLEIVSVLGENSASQRLPFVCTRPPKLNGGSAKKSRSPWEKIPNWKRGVPLVVPWRWTLFHEPRAVLGVTAMLYLVESATRPAYGPVVSVLKLDAGFPCALGVKPIT